jgi:hypothetical protein
VIVRFGWICAPAVATAVRDTELALARLEHFFAKTDGYDPLLAEHFDEAGDSFALYLF